MAKRPNFNLRNKKSRSKKTKKRLAAKHARNIALAAKKPNKGRKNR